MVNVNCERCGSESVIKYGKAIRMSSIKQIYYCNDCNFKFIPSQFKNTHYSIELASKCCDLYFQGASLRKIKHYLLRNENLQISARTIERYIKQTILQVKPFIESLAPITGDTFCVDETMFNCRKEPLNHSWNIAVIDSKTRMIMSNVSCRTRTQEVTNQALKEAIENTTTPVKAVVSDGLNNYPQSVARVNYRIKHLNKIHFKGAINNNLIERFWGRLKDRLKPTRGLQYLNTASILLDGFVIHFNFVEPHLGIGGLTPAQKAGINLPVPCTWGELLTLSKSVDVKVTL
jgi:transposase-like protein